MTSVRISFPVYVLFTLILSYFIFHIFHGERGLYAQKKLDVKIATLMDELSELQKEREDLSWKIKHLGGNGSQKIDADLLSEKMRELGYAQKDEILLVEE